VRTLTRAAGASLFRVYGRILAPAGGRAILRVRYHACSALEWYLHTSESERFIHIYVMQQIIDLTTKTIRDIALAAPATTRIFEEFKIDYCCGGRRSIEDVCLSAGIDVDILKEKIIAAASDNKNGSGQPETLGASALIEHIIANHHLFTANELERLAPLMAKVDARHGDLHPELHELRSVLSDLSMSLLPHMRKEELVLFPYIQTLEQSVSEGRPAAPSHFGSVANPIRMMMTDHDADGERLRRMRGITKDYDLPDGACPSFTALYAGLQDLERDLHRHIHLENNVLFPKAMELEAAI
jgi:regulator of cell morphogenesis and NO signaling